MEIPLVVCVDDEPAILSALRRALRGEPYRVATTGDPGTALAWVAAGDVHLVISDQRMPSMLGSELLDEVRRLSPRTAGLILTAYPGDAAGSTSDFLLAKPWDDAPLKRTIRKLLAGVEERELNAP